MDFDSDRPDRPDHHRAARILVRDRVRTVSRGLHQLDRVNDALAEVVRQREAMLALIRSTGGTPPDPGTPDPEALETAIRYVTRLLDAAHVVTDPGGVPTPRVEDAVVFLRMSAEMWEDIAAGRR